MDILKNKFGYLSSKVGETPTYMKIIVSLILIFLIYFIFRRYSQYVSQNPLWFKNGLDAKQEEVISDSLIVRAKETVEFTYHMFVYVAEWDYNIYWFKPIIIKTMNWQQFCPALYLEPVVNNLVVAVSSESGKLHTLKVEDFPLKRWTHVAIVVKGVNVELYIGGLLAKTLPMDSPAKQNEGDLLVCPWGGFSGQVSKLAYRPKALNAKEIYELSRQSIFSFGMLAIAIKNFSICGTSYKAPTEADFETVDKNSLITFSSMGDSLANLNIVSTGLVSKLVGKAQRAKLGIAGVSKEECPVGDDAPLCPIGTLACANNQRYCYYPDRDIMVSTSFNSAKDYCPAKEIGNKEGMTPIMIAGVPVWQRQSGKDSTQCPNIK